MPAPAPLQDVVWESGRTVGPYLLLSPLAEGGMAEIWLARQSGVKGFEKLVVIKRMTKALEGDAEHIEMFLREARLAAQLNHQHVVQIFELGEEAGNYYIAMEYLDGENLSAVRRRARDLELPMSDGLAARLVSYAAEGLHYAHTRVSHSGQPLSIVHRDVSPQNLIVTYDGGLKVVDFGIAKIATQATMSGKLKGKLAYMSPEQARAQPADARSDVFSLGVVLFELVTGTRLMSKREDLEMLAFMAGLDPFPRPTERRPDVPRPLEAIIMKAMARKREERFQTARDLQGALEDWIRTSGQSASSSDVADYMCMLFADRILERQALIESALSAELTPNAARSLHTLTGTDSGSSSLSSRPPTPLPRPQPKRWVPVALLGAAALAIVGIVAAVASSATPVRPDTVLDAPVAPPVLIVDTEPGGADVEVDGEAKGKAPLTLESTLGEHKVVATRAGSERTSRVVKLEKDGQRVRVVLSLPPAKVDVPAKTPAPPVRVVYGKLSLKTDPWTSVYLGKNKLGDTPLVGIPLPAGRHTLRLVNADSRIESTIEVEIKPNEATVKKLHL